MHLIKCDRTAYLCLIVITRPHGFYGSPKHRNSSLLGVAGYVLILICALGRSASGEEFHVKNWHVEDGLPDGEITAIQQTPDGYLWVGTPKGLAQFDGARFKVFKSSSGSALTDECITWLMTTRNGTLWVSTQDGNVVRRQGGRFERVPLPPGFASNGQQNRTPGNWLWERRM